MSLGSSSPTASFSAGGRFSLSRHWSPPSRSVRNNEVCYSDIFPIACLPESSPLCLLQPKVLKTGSYWSAMLPRKADRPQCPSAAKLVVWSKFLLRLRHVLTSAGQPDCVWLLRSLPVDKASVLQTLNKITQLSCLDSGFLPKADGYWSDWQRVNPLWLCRWRRFLCLQFWPGSGLRKSLLLSESRIPFMVRYAYNLPRVKDWIHVFVTVSPINQNHSVYKNEPSLISYWEALKWSLPGVLRRRRKVAVISSTRPLQRTSAWTMDWWQNAVSSNV